MNPEKFNAPEDKEKIEFMGWKETMKRRIDGNRFLSGENHNKFLDKVDPYSPDLTIEDMGWDRKIRDKDFDPNVFKQYQNDMIERAKKKGQDDQRYNFMRSLIKPAEEVLKEREFVNRFKTKN